MAYIEFRDVSKVYRMGQTEIRALDHISFSVEKGELCVIVGPSGAGKTTLLNILGGMDAPTEGTILLDGREISALDAVQMLKDVGLEGRMDNFPAQLSGGEQQRVSIARALAKNPKIILCDEPTGALDYHTGKAVLKLLQDTCRSTGKTVLIITHNSALTRIADRVIRVKNGTVIESGVNDAPLPVERIEW